jgi:hypothetical protein
MTMTLKAFSIAEALPYVGNIGHVECAAPTDRWEGWSLQIRGPMVYLVSPRGWVRGLKLHEIKGSRGPRTVLDIPKSAVRLIWECDEFEADKIAKFDSLLFKRPVAVEAKEQP